MYRRAPINQSSLYVTMAHKHTYLSYNFIQDMNYFSTKKCYFGSNVVWNMIFEKKFYTYLCHNKHPTNSHHNYIQKHWCKFLVGIQVRLGKCHNWHLPIQCHKHSSLDSDKFHSYNLQNKWVQNMDSKDLLDQNVSIQIGKWHFLHCHKCIVLLTV